MTGAPKVYLVCYDIANEKRLPKVYKVMRGYGEPLQYSVFRCVLSDLQLAQLKDRLVSIIMPTEDQVLFVPLGSSDSKTAWRAFSLGLPIPEPTRAARVL